ncbi:hypothetical protein [Pseudomonas sp. NPDC087817]|uniref:hypothetical protein n=1 Tax=Pseudomonas sp. NPDC087817 TaxID=3364451 RepID=UPI0037FCF53F
MLTKYEASQNPDHHTSPSLEDDSSTKDEVEIINWSVRSLDQPWRDIILGPIILGLIAIALCAGVTWRMWENIGDNIESWIAICSIICGMLFGLLMITRQKTVFNFRLTQSGASIEQYLYFPNFAAPLFRTTAIAILLLFIFAAIYTGSVLFLIGPVAMTLGSIRLLLGWKNEVKQRSTQWALHDLIIIDRRRNMIIATFNDEPSVGLNLRFSSSSQLNQCLDILRTLLPNETEFREERWPW